MTADEAMELAPGTTVYRYLLFTDTVDQLTVVEPLTPAGPAKVRWPDGAFRSWVGCAFRDCALTPAAALRLKADEVRVILARMDARAAGLAAEAAVAAADEALS